MKPCNRTWHYTKLVVTQILEFQVPLSFDQMFAAKTGFAGLHPGKFFRTIVLQSEAEKLLANPDLTDDLRLRVLDSMANAEQRFNGCSSPDMMPWMQIRCSSLQLAVSKKELKAIENELTSKTATASNAEALEISAVGSSAN